MTSRSIDDLTPELQVLYWRFSSAMAAAGLTFMVTCTYRDQVTQNALYAQHRKPLDVVNKLRRLAGLPPIDEEANKWFVTWIKHSKHQDRKAFDIALIRDGKPCWDTKASVNGNDIPDYLEAARIGASVRLTPGGLWKTPDYPHFEI